MCGEQQAKKVKADAEKQAKKVKADAEKQAKKVKTDAEKQAKKVKADADELEYTDEYYENIPVSIILDVTFTHTIENFAFDGFSLESLTRIFKDGRVLSHFIEVWIENRYPIKHISGCKKYDFIDNTYPSTKYDEKTFTNNGCKFYPSNMIGEGRKFNKYIFEKKAKKLIYCIVSNINFPEIKLKFVRGITLIKLYPNGVIPLNDYIKFFN